MADKNLDRGKYKNDFYYRYLLKTNKFLNRAGLINTGKWVYYGLVIGILGAFGAIAFIYGIEFVSALTLKRAGYAGTELAPIIFEKGFRKWMILLLPALGGLLSGLITEKFAPEAKGHGTDAVIKSFHKENGLIKLRVPFVKLLATSFVIGTGGSAGREGPIAQIGAGLASFLGVKLKFTVRERRIMMLAGAAAGISAVFGAPLGGALFMAEVLYRNHEIESEAIIPAVISSIISFSLFKTIMGEGHFFTIKGAAFNSAFELVPYLMLGILCAAVGVFYVKFFDRITEEFRGGKRVPGYLRPALGGFIVGAIAMFLPQVLAGGYNYIQMAFNRELPVYLMALLVLGKIIATSFTIGSGGSGGVFAPSLFIGAMLGGAAYGVMGSFLPQSWMPPQQALAVVGMGGFFAGIARVPIASLVLVSEMTKGYELLVPMMLVSSIAFLINRHPYTLYEEQAASVIESPAHKGDFEIDILQDIRVKDVPIESKNVIVMQRRTPLKKVIHEIVHTKQDTFPVVDARKNNVLIGVFTLEDIREELAEPELLEAAVADDIASKDYEFVTPEEDLHSAMNKFIARDYDALPVMDEKNGKFIGLLTRTAFIKVYTSKIAQLKNKKN